MAKEIEFTDTSGLTEYANLVNSVGQWYNASSLAFEAFNAANWTSYKIAATEFGTSGIYSADMPSVSRGYYNLVARQQTGGAAAQTDPVVGTGEVDWTGSAILDTESSVWNANPNNHNTVGLFGYMYTLVTRASYAQDVYNTIVGIVAAHIVDTGPTTTVFKTDLTDETNKWNDCVLVITQSGALTQEARPILSYSQTNGTITLAEPLSSVPANGSTFNILISHVHPVTQIADGFLARNVLGGSSTGRLVSEALATLRNKVAFDVPTSGNFTVYSTDDLTPLWTGAYTASAGANPVTIIDPA